MTFDLTNVQDDIKNILEKEKENYTTDHLKTIFSLIDLTSLKPTDNATNIKDLCRKVNDLQNHYSDMPKVAAICVYPSMVEYVREELSTKDVQIASVAAGFPASQTFLSIKVAESELAVGKGANEIDIVISLGQFIENNFDFVAKEIRIIKEAIAPAHLKVILETGLLSSLDHIYKASILAINSGADFIKTSTGKEDPAASLEAVYVMCKAIKNHYDTTGIKIGLKPAGGISTAEEVFKYYAIVKHILGEEWLNNQYFRIGASRLANDLIKEIYKFKGKTITKAYF